MKVMLALLVLTLLCIFAPAPIPPRYDEDDPYSHTRTE